MSTVVFLRNTGWCDTLRRGARIGTALTMANAPIGVPQLASEAAPIRSFVPHPNTGFEMKQKQSDPDEQSRGLGIT